MSQPPSSLPPDDDSDLWLFGYGSLIWKSPPHYGEGGRKDQRVPGYITGYVRRFWQASEDHRGTPSSPGRVVTLISHTEYHRLLPSSPSSSSSSPIVWGAAYRIPAPHVPAVQTYLDIREINGYSIQYTSFTPATATLLHHHHHSAPIEKCMVYIGLPENPQFLGAQPPADVAAVIARSKGPSGENVEYLFMLERALRELGDAAGDEHVEDLARRVREIKGRDHGGGDDGLGDGVAGEAVDGGLKKVEDESSSHEQVETEKY